MRSARPTRSARGRARPSRRRRRCRPPRPAREPGLDAAARIDSRQRPSSSRVFHETTAIVTCGLPLIGRPARARPRSPRRSALSRGRPPSRGPPARSRSRSSGSPARPPDRARRARVGVARLDEEAVLAVAQVLGRAPGAGRDHRRADRHRLQRHEPERLRPLDAEEQRVGGRRTRPRSRRAAGARSAPATRRPRSAASAAEPLAVPVVAAADAAQRAAGQRSRAPRSRSPRPCAGRGARGRAGSRPTRRSCGGGEGRRVDPGVHDRRLAERQPGGDRALAQVGARRRSSSASRSSRSRGRHPRQRPGRPSADAPDGRRRAASRRPAARRRATRRPRRRPRGRPAPRARSSSDIDIPPIAHQATASGSNSARWRSRRVEVVALERAAGRAPTAAGTRGRSSTSAARGGRRRPRRPPGRASSSRWSVVSTRTSCPAARSCSTLARQSSSYPPWWCGGYMLPTVSTRIARPG